MTIKSIFSDSLIPDVEKTIIFWTDNRSLAALSCTQKYAYQVLENEGIFKERFKELYKWTTSTPEILFPHFQENYPDCCWKITSCLYPDEPPVVVFNKTFLQASESYQKVTEHAPIEIFDLQNQLQDICGIGFADPNSRIHQAWENFQAAARSYEEYSAGRGDFDFSAYMQHSEAYRDIDYKRINIENKIVALESDNLEKDVLGGLLVDQYFNKNPFLTINQLASNRITIVREIFYHTCANGVIEDNWADNHYHEHIPHQVKIGERLISNAQNFKAAFLADLETGIENYASHHLESFSQALSFFQESLISYTKALQTLKNDTENAIDFYSIYSDTIFPLMDKMDQDLSHLPEITVFLEFLDKIFDCPGLDRKEYIEQILQQKIQVYELLVKYTQLNILKNLG